MRPGRKGHLVRAARAVRRLREQTAGVLNRWYDKRMYRPLAEERYAGSDFFNYGYWRKDTRTQKEASENLMQMLLSGISRKTGTILDVACGRGGTTRFLLRDYPPENITGINIS